LLDRTVTLTPNCQDGVIVKDFSGALSQGGSLCLHVPVIKKDYKILCDALGQLVSNL
jgi:hypothetical protein